MNELGNTPADKNYKPSGIVNDLMEGQLKAVQLSNGTLVTEELAKSMTRAQEAALKAFPGQQFIHDRCVFRFGYETAEKDLGLTWEDVETINRLTSEVCSEFFGDPCGSEDFDREKTYTEVLRRFNERKK